VVGSSENSNEPLVGDFLTTRATSSFSRRTLPIGLVKSLSRIEKCKKKQNVTFIFVHPFHEKNKVPEFVKLATGYLINVYKTLNYKS
jgi:hypothetical protein